jgi:phage terminase large subunit GpA-like protein
MVQRFLRTTVNRRIFAIVGRAGALPIWPRKMSHKTDSVFYLVGIDSIKDSIAARLRLAEYGPGYCHFPIGPNYDLDHFEQLTAERKYTSYHHGFPRREWRKKEGARNEALDCRVYAYAALHALYASGLRLNTESDRLARMLQQASGTRAEVQAAIRAAGPGEPPPPPPRSTPARGPRIIGRFAL